MRGILGRFGGGVLSRFRDVRCTGMGWMCFGVVVVLVVDGEYQVAHLSIAKDEERHNACVFRPLFTLC